MTTADEELPPLVASAHVLARRAGFALTRDEAGPGRPSACLPGTGRFLAMLAAGCVRGRIGELGTGTGVGAAWIASAMPASCVLITVDSDAQRAAVARDLLAPDSRVEVITGDAREVISSRGPFDLLFADSGIREVADFSALVSLLRIGGRIVMDDLTPLRALPPDSPLHGLDPKRRLFGSERGLSWTEVVLPDLRNSLLVGTRTT